MMSVESKTVLHDKSLRELDKGFSYRADFNVNNLKKILGLNGESTTIRHHLPIWEVVRLSNMLKRHNALSGEELEYLRNSTPPEMNPREKKECPVHGEWYHDAWGCTHHDHTNPHHETPFIDKVCKH